MNEAMLSKLNVLSRLAETEGNEAEKLLQHEYKKIKPKLLESNNYEEISNSIKFITTFSYRVSNEIAKDLQALIRRLKTAELVISSEPYYDRYYNTNEKLQVEALSCLSKLRYLQGGIVADVLFEMSAVSNELVRNSTLKELGEFAKIDLRIFQDIGLEPQNILLSKINEFSNDKIKEIPEAILIVLDCFFSTEMTSVHSDYKTFTFTTTSVVADLGFETLRARALLLLQKMYYFDTGAEWKFRALKVFNSATHYNPRGEVEGNTQLMVAKGTVQIQQFYQKLIAGEELQIIQKIEHYAFWNFYHSSTESVLSAALEVEDEIKKHKEYQIYRDLVGFDGIFGNWKEEKESGNCGLEDRELQTQKISSYVAAINQENYSAWKARIMKYSENNSRDLATFPKMYQFLHEASVHQPELFLNLLVEERDHIKPFLIAIMNGLWETRSKARLKSVMRTWIKEELYLNECAKLFLSVNSIDKNIFEDLFNKGIELENTNLLSIIISVIFRKAEEEKVNLVGTSLISSLKMLTKLENSDWIFNVSVGKKSIWLFSSLGDDLIDAILENILYVQSINYETDEILNEIAKIAPQKVLSYFKERIRLSIEKDNSLEYEAIPYKLHLLGESLSKKPKVVLKTVHSWYREENNELFRFREAKLLRSVFPVFSVAFEAELISIVNTKDEDDIQFVIEILKAYSGQKFLYKVAMTIVGLLPENDGKLNEIQFILSATGIVSGEYGFSEAYKQKIDLLKPWANNDNKKIISFVSSFTLQLDRMVKSERIRADEEIELRKYQFGENKG